MPKLVAKIEGRGNGIKTNIVNNVDIARALDRPPTYTLKHFGCELGAQTNFDKKTGTSIVNGAHNAKKLSEVLEIFIKKYVQCYSCGNPETVVKVRKDKIFLKCKACGHISEVDMRDKLTTFIVKNPPEIKLTKSEAKVKKDEKERMKAAEKEAKRAEKAEKKKKEKNGKGDSKSKDDDEADSEEAQDTHLDTPGDEDDDGTEWKTDISADAVARRQREQLTSAAAALVQGSKEHGDENNQASLPEAAEEMDLSDAIEEGAQPDEELQPIELVLEYIQSGKSPLGLLEIMNGENMPEDLVDKMKVFYAGLLKVRDGNIVDKMAQCDKYILALKQDDDYQASNLIALEHYLTQQETEHMADMPFILKMLYEEDLIEDHVIIKWGSQPNCSSDHGVDQESAETIRKLSQKVLEWLEESEDESEEDES